MISTTYDIGYDLATDIAFDIDNLWYHSPLILEFSCYRSWHHGTCTTGWRCLRPPRTCCSTNSCLPIACKSPMHRSHWSFQYGLGGQVGVVLKLWHGLIWPAKGRALSGAARGNAQAVTMYWGSDSLKSWNPTWSCLLSSCQLFQVRWSSFRLDYSGLQLQAVHPGLGAGLTQATLGWLWNQGLDHTLFMPGPVTDKH